MVSFQHNPYLRGMKWYRIIFDMIVNKRVIDIEYYSFDKYYSRILGFGIYLNISLNSHAHTMLATK